jgi:hypothetical protein
MNEVASVSKHTASFIYKHTTLFGLVLWVYLMILSQLMTSMSELAFLLVRTEPALYKLFAQLALLLVLMERLFARMKRLLSVAVFTRWLGVDCGSRGETFLVETLCVEGVSGVFFDEMSSGWGHDRKLIIINKVIEKLKGTLKFIYLDILFASFSQFINNLIKYLS